MFVYICTYVRMLLYMYKVIQRHGYNFLCQTQKPCAQQRRDENFNALFLYKIKIDSSQIKICMARIRRINILLGFRDGVSIFHQIECRETRSLLDYVNAYVQITTSIGTYVRSYLHTYLQELFQAKATTHLRCNCHSIVSDLVSTLTLIVFMEVRIL